MDDRLRSSLLWGVVGLLAFLVLTQGLNAFTDRVVDPVVMVGGALVVGVGATAATYLTADYLPDDEDGESGEGDEPS